MDATLGCAIPLTKHYDIPTATEINTYRRTEFIPGYGEVVVSQATEIKTIECFNRMAVEQIIPPPSIGYDVEESNGLAALFDRYEAAEQWDKCQDIVDYLARQTDISVPKTHPRSKRGLKGMTGHGRKMVKSALALLQDKHGKDRLTFGTITLPTMTTEHHSLVCEQWSEFCRQFFQELTRLLARKGLDVNYVSVTENQEKRCKNYGLLFSPHLHYVHQGRHKNGTWLVKPLEIRAIVQRILANITKVSHLCDSCERLERIKKDVVGYMCKYMTKGSQSSTNVPPSMIPSSWYGLTNALRDEVKSKTIKKFGDVATELFYSPELYVDMGIITRFHYVYSDDGKCVGMSCRFKSKQALNDYLTFWNNE